MTPLALAAARLRDALREYPARAPLGQAAYVLHPLEYAWENHQTYLERYMPEGRTVEAVFLGMNPGPWGMAQTGVPFGTPDMTREFLDIHGRVRAPARTHPKRPIGGVDSPRNEVSGQRIWGSIRACFGTPEAFFARFFISNYCPLVFQTESGANLTPDKLPREIWAEIEPACDAHLRDVLTVVRPRTVIGIGKWAEQQARRVVAANRLEVRVEGILHPSPANPQSHRWLEVVSEQLALMGHPWPRPETPAQGRSRAAR